MNSFSRRFQPTRGYVCRSCGHECFNKGAFIRCPVCGIKWS